MQCAIIKEFSQRFSGDDANIKKRIKLKRTFVRAVAFEQNVGQTTNYL